MKSFPLLILALFAFTSLALKWKETIEDDEDTEIYELEDLNIVEVFKRAIEMDKRGEKIEPTTPWLKTCGGWTSMEMCSTVFGSGIDEQTAWEEDAAFIGRVATVYSIDYEEKSVTATCTLQNPRNESYKAIWRQGLGCTLVEKFTEAEIRATNVGNMNPPDPLNPDIPWPLGEGFFPELIPDDVDLDCLEAFAADHFDSAILNTRALVVIYRGQLVFEHYAPGITKDSKLIGWSATKSLTQALVGILVGDGRLDIYKPAQIPEWYENQGDPRQNITIDMMLRMSSGTRWVGDLPPTTECIFWSDCDCAHRCGLKPLVAEPDTLWNYNSGSSYLLSRLVLESRGDPQWTNYEWPKQRLFYPIGAHSMYIEYQANGYFLGGAYGYGTARDWARFGLLYLRDGVWIDGNRILPQGWVDYSSTTTHTYERYAAHFWKHPRTDDKLFFASGFRGQNVYILPDHELVIVRLAMPPIVMHPAFRHSLFLNRVLACFPNATASAGK